MHHASMLLLGLLICCIASCATCKPSPANDCWPCQHQTLFILHIWPPRLKSPHLMPVTWLATSTQVVTELGTADIDARLEELLIDGILYAFQEQVSDDADVMLNGFGTVVNALKVRRRRASGPPGRVPRAADCPAISYTAYDVLLPTAGGARRVDTSALAPCWCYLCCLGQVRSASHVRSQGDGCAGV